MKMRSLVMCTVVATLVLFVWQAISNAAIPWHRATERTFADTSVAAAKALRAQMPTNGVYYSKYGVFAAVQMTPDMKDLEKAMGPMLARQAVLDVFVVWALMLLAARAREGTTAAGYGTLAALGAAACGIVMQFSDWNWYGFSFSYACVNVVDAVIGFWITGWVIGFMLLRDRRSAGVSVPAGAGYSSAGSSARV